MYVTSRNDDLFTVKNCNRFDARMKWEIDMCVVYGTTIGIFISWAISRNVMFALNGNTPCATLIRNAHS